MHTVIKAGRFISVSTQITNPTIEYLADKKYKKIELETCFECIIL